MKVTLKINKSTRTNKSTQIQSNLLHILKEDNFFFRALLKLWQVFPSAINKRYAEIKALYNKLCNK